MAQPRTFLPRLGTGVQKRADNRLPFLVERPGARRLFCLAIPVLGIAAVALDAVKIGVHPGGIAPGFVHDDAMRLVPVAVLRPPQRLERRRALAVQTLERRRQLQDQAKAAGSAGDSRLPTSEQRKLGRQALEQERVRQLEVRKALRRQRV